MDMIVSLRYLGKGARSLSMGKSAIGDPVEDGVSGAVSRGGL